MELKKIILPLREALEEIGLTKPTTLQFETWSSLKSGMPCVLLAESGSGKSTALGMLLIQKLQKAEGESTRALLLVPTKEDVLRTVDLLREMASRTNLRMFGVHEKGDIDYDKNQLSLGVDILVGTPVKINALFSSAGFNLNTIRHFVVDDADIIFKNREDSIVLRLLTSVDRTQLIYAASTSSERFESMIDKTMEEPVYFDFTDEETY